MPLRLFTWVMVCWVHKLHMLLCAMLCMHSDSPYPKKKTKERNEISLVYTDQCIISTYVYIHVQ